MAPLKPLNKQSSLLVQQLPFPKSKNTLKAKDAFPKRKADSPLKRTTIKRERAAFGDVTNAQAKENIHESKVKAVLKKTFGTRTKPLCDQNVKPTHIKDENCEKLEKINPTVRKKTSVIPVSTKPQVQVKVPVPAKITGKTKTLENTNRPVTRSTRKSSSLESTSDGSSLYVSALEALDLEDKPTTQTKSKVRQIPDGVVDIDKEYIGDVTSAADYAFDIFEYLRSRESKFKVDEYIGRQKSITSGMRALLVDWMVEVQENFELNHETLYLAVKIVDLYLSKVIVSSHKLQLVGCASMFVACKYDERIPPLIEDFLYLCEDLYTAEELIGLEIEILKTLDYDLGAPLSYRFLRRYARGAKIQMPMLTLARYILETSLMEYSTASLSDSKIAAASLYLALRMKNEGSWSPTLEYYSGYKLEDFKEIVLQLNTILHKPRESLKTIRSKYSHKLFYEVALTPLLANSDLEL